MTRVSASQFEHFEILRRPEDGALWVLGSGGMGTTYKAIDTRLKVTVALKIMHDKYAEDEHSFRYFLREARAAAALNHPNIARVVHLSDKKENCFYAMEFIDGETLDSYVQRCQGLSAHEALPIVQQTARALSAAHDMELVHRDIKPLNIMLINDVQEDILVVKLIDFGLAKSFVKEGRTLFYSAVSGGFQGSHHFASPEQFKELTLDCRSDIYSLGVTLWYMLTGGTLFRGTNLDVSNHHLGTEPPYHTLPTGLHPSVATLLSRMLAKDPANRPQTPAELRREIKDCLKAMTGQATVILPNGERAQTEETPTSSADPAEIATAISTVEATAASEEAVTAEPGTVIEITEQAPPPDSFVLVESLRRRGALSVDDVLTLLDRLTPQIAATPKAPDLHPARIAVQFPSPPPNLSELPSRPLYEWPQNYHLVLDFYALYDTASPNWQTALPGQTGSATGLNRVPAIAGLVYELLNGCAAPAGSYRPTSLLNEPANLLLRECLSNTGPVKTVEQFSQTLRETIQSGRYPKPLYSVAAVELVVEERSNDLAPVTEQPSEIVGTNDVSRREAALAKSSFAQSEPERKSESKPPTLASQPPLPRIKASIPNQDAKEAPSKPLLSGEWLVVAGVAAVLVVGVTAIWFYARSSNAAPSRPGPSHAALSTNAPAAANTVEPAPTVTAARLVSTPAPAPSLHRLRPENATRQQPYVNGLGMKFVPLPGTKVLAGVNLTTRKDYAAFAQAISLDHHEWEKPELDGVPVSQADNYPVVMVSWEEANAFCAWLSGTESETAGFAVTYRLPNSTEWQKARGDSDYPWGNQWPPPPGAGNYADISAANAFQTRRHHLSPIPGYNDGFATTSPVDSFPVNALGLHDTGGNVKQWCLNLDNQGYWQYVGSSWQDAERLFLGSRKPGVQPRNLPRATVVGFRCVLELPSG